MSVLKILEYPDKRLRIIAKPVLEVNKKIQIIIKNMFETMYYKDGIGLAATQVNIPLKIIVINKIDPLIHPLVLINPKIIKQSGTISTQEGCLSIPNYQARITRFNKITVSALNYFGQKIELHINSILSICIQHEIDHLQGKLFIDYLSHLKQQRILKKIKKQKKYDT